MPETARFVSRPAPSKWLTASPRSRPRSATPPHPIAEEFSCDAPIATEPTSAGARDIDPAGLPAQTLFRLLRRDPDGTSLVEARPLTGRTNQIRAHLWHLGHPILGDPVYLKNRELGASQTLRPSDPPMCLHAHRLAIRHPLDNALVRFESPSPTWAI